MQKTHREKLHLIKTAKYDDVLRDAIFNFPGVQTTDYSDGYYGSFKVTMLDGYQILELYRWNESELEMTKKVAREVIRYWRKK